MSSSLSTVRLPDTTTILVGSEVFINPDADAIERGMRDHLVKKHGHGPFEVISMAAQPFPKHPHRVTFKDGNGQHQTVSARYLTTKVSAESLATA